MRFHLIILQTITKYEWPLKQISMKSSSYSKSLYPCDYAHAGNLFGSNKPSKVLFSSEDNDDYYSPTDWEQDPTESDADYEERTEDLNDWLDYNN